MITDKREPVVISVTAVLKGTSKLESTKPTNSKGVDNA